MRMVNSTYIENPLGGRIKGNEHCWVEWSLEGAKDKYGIIYIEQLGEWKFTEEDSDFEYVLLRFPWDFQVDCLKGQLSRNTPKIMWTTVNRLGNLIVIQTLEMGESF